MVRWSDSPCLPFHSFCQESPSKGTSWCRRRHSLPRTQESSEVADMCSDELGERLTNPASKSALGLPPHQLRSPPQAGHLLPWLVMPASTQTASAMGKRSSAHRSSGEFRDTGEHRVTRPCHGRQQVKTQKAAIYMEKCIHSGLRASSRDREEASLAVEDLTSNTEGRGGKTQASLAKLQALASRAQSWQGGLCGEVTQDSNNSTFTGSLVTASEPQ